MEVVAEPKEEAAPTEVVAAEALTPLSPEVQQSPLDLWRMISTQARHEDAVRRAVGFMPHELPQEACVDGRKRGCAHSRQKRRR